MYVFYTIMYKIMVCVIPLEAQYILVRSAICTRLAISIDMKEKSPDLLRLLLDQRWEHQASFEQNIPQLGIHRQLL